MVLPRIQLNFCAIHLFSELDLYLEPINLKFEFFAHVWKINKSEKFSHLLPIFHIFYEICCEKLVFKISY